MTETFSDRALPDLSTMTKLCEERILLCGPCEALMSEEEWRARHVRVNRVAEAWTEAERTDFWYTLDRLCADHNPAIRSTPGLVITPEVLAAESTRLGRISARLMGGEGEPQGLAVWGFTLYTDPIIYSFTDEELARYAAAKTKIAFGEFA